MGTLLKFISLVAFIVTIVRSSVEWMVFTILILFLAIAFNNGEKKVSKNTFPKNSTEKNLNNTFKEDSNGNNLFYS